MFKRFVLVFSAALIFLMLSGVSAYASQISVSAEAAVLMDAGTGEVLFSKNPDERLSMASTTKIMTSLIALEKGDLSSEITVTDEMVRVEGTSIGLISGDTISLEELVYGMLLESGNDAANVTAYAVAGSIDAFVSLMNEKAAEIGMTNTNFVTPSGLDSDAHYSTAYDMALLGSYAVGNETFLDICSTYSICVSYGNPPYNRYFTNHNKMLKYYDGAVGIKTGYTKKSGRCLVSAAVRNGVTLVCVTLNDPNDWSDHEKMLDYGFSMLKRCEINEERAALSVPCVGSDKSFVSTGLSYIPEIYTVSESEEITCKIEAQPFLYAPIRQGDIVGTAYFYRKNGKLVSCVPIISCEDAECITEENSVSDKKSFFEKIIDFLKGE